METEKILSRQKRQKRIYLGIENMKDETGDNQIKGEGEQMECSLEV